MRPNLFSLATKELSQDAFLVWLLQWASPKCRCLDVKLNACAVQFALKLLSLQTDAPSEITEIKAGRQWNNIDVWAEINGKYLLIIEDKTMTGAHSNQLQRYRDAASAWCKDTNFNLVCVYLKTGSESASTIEQITAQGFAVFQRRNFLGILNTADVKNDIFIDFRDRLQSLDDEENQFASKPLKHWNAPDWRGFYQEIERLRPIVRWEFVNNPTGGFWNALLNWFELKDCNPFMQVEQGPLCFKIGEVYENRREIRDYYHNLLMAHCASRCEIRKPNLRPGTYMTIAVVDRVNWLGADDDLVDVQRAVRRLNEYEKLYVQFIDSIRGKTDSTSAVVSCKSEK